MEPLVVVLLIAVLVLWLLQTRSADRLESRHDLLRQELRRLQEELNRLQLKVDGIRRAEPPPMAKPETKPIPEPPVVQSPSSPSVLEIPKDPVPAAQAAPPPLPPRAAPPRAAQPAPPLGRRFDWEALVGVKLFSWIAGIALVIAAVFFLKYSVDHGWLGPGVRMAIGLLTGASLLVICEWKAARRFAVTANALDAAGIAVLFSTFYASHVLWNLLGTIPTFAAMALVTAVAVLLSIGHDSLFIAGLGLIGGFATPALLSTGEDRPIGLFSYLFLLNAGLAWVAYRKRWPQLTAASAVFTTLYQWGWVLKFMRPDRVPLAMGIFLLFPLLNYVSLIFGERRERPAPGPSTFARTTGISVALPLLFALFMAGNSTYGSHYGLLFGFLFLIDTGLAVIAARRGLEILHLVAGLLTVTTFCTWLALSYRHEAWPVILAITAIFVLLYLAADSWCAGFVAEGRIALYTAPLLLVVFPVLAQMEPATASPFVLFVALFLLMAILAAYAILKRHGTVHYLAAFFALAAEAVWSARNLDSSRLIAGLTIYVIFGLFYLGVPLAARRWNRQLEPVGGSVMVLFASLGLLFFMAAGSAAESALWGIGLLLVILNIGLLVESRIQRRSVFVMSGTIVSWLVLAVWWWRVPLTAHLVSGLVMVAGFAFMVLGTGLWRSHIENRAGGSAPVQGMHLALAGHAFLLFVALQPALVVSPWPFLAVMGVLDLAIGVAGLYSRRGDTYAIALAASQFILIAWLFTVDAAPWPSYAAGFAVLLAAYGFTWFFVSHKQMGFAVAALAVCLSGIVVLMACVTLSATPGVAWLSITMAALLGLTLAIGWFTDWRKVAPLSVLLAALVQLTWSAAQFTPELWRNEFAFAAAIYAVYLIYPVVLGSRVTTQLSPYLAAVLASAVFFGFGRHALLAARFGGIGLLPVVQSLLMAALLWRLLQLEPAGARTLGRLAMMAGAVLAFVTIAIPLQLEKQWITIGWALLAAALAWLWLRIPHRGLLMWTGGLLAAVFMRLALNPYVLSYHPRSETPIWNWYLYTYLICAAAFLAASWLLRRKDTAFFSGMPQLQSLAAGGGTILLFLLLNIEIADYYSKGSALTFNFNAGLAQDLTYTIGWGVFAFGLLTIGIGMRNKPGRIAAIALLSGTIAKCFLHDLWQLGGLYRVGSFVGLAICLTLVALLLQRFVLQPQVESE